MGVEVGGEGLYLDSTAKQTLRNDSLAVGSSSKEVSQPTVFKETRLTGEDPVIVAEWEYSEFVWLSEFLDRLPSRYLSLLDSLSVDPEKYSLEVEGFYVYRHKRVPRRRCAVDRIFLPVIHSGPYHPYSSVKHRRRASDRALERLEFLESECRKRRVKFDYLVKIDLTLPKRISEMWDSEKVDRCVHKAVKEFLSELHRELFGTHDSQFGAISNHHYWATKTPLSPHRHVHLTVPNVVYNRRTGMFHRFRPWIADGLIKEVWQRVLKRNGLWVSVPGHVLPDCWVGYIKFEDRGKVMHRLSYCCRRSIEDLVRNLTDSDLMDFDEEFARFLLDYTPRRINFGFLTNLKRFGYSHKSSLLRCPICGGEMVAERDAYGHVKLYDRPPPDVPRLFRDRRGFWRLVQDLTSM